MKRITAIGCLTAFAAYLLAIAYFIAWLFDPDRN